MTKSYDIAKYRVKISHFTEQGYMPKGVIHIGAHDGEEVRFYEMMGIKNILCFEPLPMAVKDFKRSYPFIRIYQLALGSVDGERKFYVTDDGRGGQSSSLYYPLDEVHAQTGGVKKIINVRVQRFDSFLRGKTINLNNFDCVVIDVQGAELDVLKGMGAYIERFKYFNIECSEEPVYEGGACAQDVIDYMEYCGFTQDSPIQSHDDIFFIRSDIKPESEVVYHGLA